jgi:hypothetical protein
VVSTSESEGGVPSDDGVEVGPAPAAASSTSTSSSSSTSSDPGKEPAVSSGSAAPGPVAAAPALVVRRPTSSSDAWHVFKFCKIFDNAHNHEHVGWQATCSQDLQSLPGNPCRKTMRFSANGVVDRSERLLKWWCLACHTVESHKHHLKIVFPDELPSFEELEVLYIQLSAIVPSS